MKVLTFAATTLAATLLASAATAATKTAVFAGGCFWSVEKFFEATPGVVNAVSGYSGGTTANPTYRNHAGHLEAVRVTYDPAKVSYAQLVSRFYRNIDPTDPNGMICDYGASYRAAVFVSNPTERQAAEAERATVEKLLGARVTVVTRNAAPFYNAEGYHQDYAKKNPAEYADYLRRCGRERALKVIWGGR